MQYLAGYRFIINTRKKSFNFFYIDDFAISVAKGDFKTRSWVAV